MKKSEKKIRDKWNTVKMFKSCVIGISEWKKRENRADTVFKEMIVENFPNWRKTSSQRMCEALWALGRMNTKNAKFRHIIAKLWKPKTKRKS